MKLNQINYGKLIVFFITLLFLNNLCFAQNDTLIQIGAPSLYTITGKRLTLTFNYCSKTDNFFIQACTDDYGCSPNDGKTHVVSIEYPNSFEIEIKDAITKNAHLSEDAEYQKNIFTSDAFKLIVSGFTDKSKTAAATFKKPVKKKPKK